MTEKATKNATSASKRRASRRSPPAPEIPEEMELLTRARLPWETAAEYNKFWFFLHAGPSRSVRKAYRLHEEAAGREPKKDPPSSWYKLYRGEFAAFTKAEKQRAAIERAGEVHGRFPDWERLEAVIKLRGELKQYEDDPEIFEVMRGLTLTQHAFWSLAIDLAGDPLPGRLTWDEELAAAAGRPE